MCSSDLHMPAKAGLLGQIHISHAATAQTTQQQEFTNPQVAEIGGSGTVVRCTGRAIV